jgi:predicted Rossmann fold nucleotide-binding protein DprA/Smf involved in DNA uptake
MLGALDTEGTAIGVLADSLLRACSSARYRRHVKGGNLVLVSPFHPEAGFSAGKAMARNRYIYCLAQAAAVVHSGTTGGTWTGAHENLEKGWVPLWVRPTRDSRAGNSRLVEAGGRWLPETVEDLRVDRLMLPPEKPEPSPETTAGEQASEAAERSFYGLFLLEAEELCSRQAQTPDSLAAAMKLRKAQVADWLKQAVEDGLMDKLARPVRYRWTGGRGAREGRQIGLFENTE